jgi:hypothetical protein
MSCRTGPLPKCLFTAECVTSAMDYPFKDSAISPEASFDWAVKQNLPPSVADLRKKCARD